MSCECMNNDHYKGIDAEYLIHHMTKVKVDFSLWEVEYLCLSSGKRWIYSSECPERLGGGIPHLDIFERQYNFVSSNRTYVIAQIQWCISQEDNPALYPDTVVIAPIEINDDEYVNYSVYLSLHDCIRASSDTTVTVCIAPIIDEYSPKFFSPNTRIKIMKGITVIAVGTITDMRTVPLSEFTSIFHDLHVNNIWLPEAMNGML